MAGRRAAAAALRCSLLLAGASLAAADCAFRQDCFTGSSPGCRPEARSPNDTKPEPYTGPAMFNVCPQYSEMCCTAIQMQTLWVNFQGIYSAFGNIQGGGCPACYQNVVDFWCAYTCHPNQTDFVKVLGAQNVTDPVSTQVVEVLVTQMTLNPSYACATFGTCKDTGKVKEFAPLQTCEGFFAYQGDTEAIQDGHNYIDFQYNATNPKALSLPLNSCCNYPASIDPQAPPGTQGLNVSCPCATCSGMCAGGQCEGGGAAYPGLGVVNDNPLNQFSGRIVGLCYGVTFVAALAVILARRSGYLGAGAKPAARRAAASGSAAAGSSTAFRGGAGGRPRRSVAAYA